MSEQDKAYFARRAAEEAERALEADDPSAQSVHRRMQRIYTEKASIGERDRQPIV